MQFLKNISLQRKQTLIIMLTSGVALLLACMTFVTYDVITFRRTMVNNLSTLAEIVGNNSSAALDFDDPTSAVETLSALRAEPNIESGCIYTQDGKVFAVYDRPDDKKEIPPPPPQQNGHYFKENTLHLFRQIIHNEEVVGTVYVESDLNALYSRLSRYAAIVLGVFLAASLVALLISKHLQKIISGPILHLVQTTRAVAREKNFSMRAVKQSDDELGALVDSFNEMLSEIQLRDVELQKSKDALEERVRERTLELGNSLSLLHATLESTTDGILVADGLGKVSHFNEHFVRMWNIPREIAKAEDEEGMLEVALAQLKEPEKFLSKVRDLYGRPEMESFDLLEFKDGRIFERYSKPQHVSEKFTGRVWSFRDITGRKKAEEILRRTEELYRRAIAGADAVPYSYDYKTRSYLFMGDGIEQLTGYKMAEITPQLWKLIIQESSMAGETAGLSKEDAAKRVASGEIRNWRCDMRIKTKEGKYRWLADTSVQNLDDTGHPTGAMGILQDITERKQTEITAQAFSKLGQNLSAAASPAEAARVISEVSDDLLGWDACWVQIYSEKDDLIYSIFNTDTVDGKRFVNSPIESRTPSEMHRRVMSSGAELILRDKTDAPLAGAVSFGNKSRLSAAIMMVPLRFGKRVIGILSIQSYTPNAYGKQDLTTLQTLADQCGGALERIWADEALRKSESQFRVVWESSADGMRLANRDGTVLMANDTYCRMVGKSKTEIEGHSLGIVHHKDNIENILRKHREQIDARKAHAHLEKEVTLWNDKKIWFELSNSILELPGQPLLLLTIFRDITRRKQAETELEIMHNQLLDTSRQAGMAEVATSVLHNVGNVLNSVNVSSSLIRERIKKSRISNLNKVAALFQEHDGGLPEFFAHDPRGKQLPGYLSQLAVHLSKEQEEVLQEVGSLVNNIEHIKEIVAMQQSYAKVSGMSESLQVIDLVEDALRMNAGSLERHQVEVCREYSEAPHILVEKHKVLQILINLIRNAKYACDEARRPDKLIRVRVTSDQNFLTIAVIDNGIGIPPENLTRIFNHGFTTRTDGHGFGLHSGALAAIELGGSLNGHSDGLGKGAEFTLKLPVKINSKEEGKIDL